MKRLTVTRSRVALITAALIATVVPLGMATTTGADVVVTPSTNDLHLDPGEVFGPETINVQIPAGTTPADVDVYFLADTTGSMGGPIGAVQAAATATLLGLQASLPGVSLAFGVSDYKDEFDSYLFNEALEPTTDIPSVQTAIDGWAAAGGGDAAEGQIYALDQLTKVDAGWRPGAERIVVWFGDCPGHDPSSGATEATTTANLQAAGITVLAIGTNTGCPDDLNGTDDGAVAGQANRITAATGGTYVSGIVAGTIVDTITGLVEGAVADINQVTLVPTAEIAPFVTSIDPAAYGPLDGNVSHSLDFDVTFTGTHCGLAGPEEFNGSLDVMVDGSKVGEKTVKITVPGCNVAPTDLALVCQLTPVAINTPATLSFSFTDPDATDAHDVDIAWDDTTSSHIDLAAGVTAGAADHTYTAVGVYQPTVTVTDSFGETVEATCENYIVVFDPNGGFVTGGGWIDTAPGSYPADPTLDGRANFGFVSKYKKGQIVPTGNTEFQFHATDFNFHSEDYEWLIVSGSKAQFKGTGTINGEGSYKFMVTATDGGTGKTATPDTFRIKITDGSTVVYDNKLGGSDEFGAAPTQDIGSGSIVIHK